MSELPRLNARETVIAGMTAILPPDVPLSFVEVLRAHFEGSGLNRRAVADVRMFDGRPARLSVAHWGARECPGWTVKWLELEGGDVSWEEGRWVHVPFADHTNDEPTPPTQTSTGTGEGVLTFDELLDELVGSRLRYNAAFQAKVFDGQVSERAREHHEARAAIHAHVTAAVQNAVEKERNACIAAFEHELAPNSSGVCRAKKAIGARKLLP